MKEKTMANKNLILKIKAGSHLYGLNTKNSDDDYIGIFIPDEKYILGLNRCEIVDLSKQIKDENGKNKPESIDYKVYSLQKFIHLAKDNNPNILEVLFVAVNNIEFISEEGQTILDNKLLFPYLGLFDKFVGYAISQQKKMQIKKENYDALQRAKETLIVIEGLELSFIGLTVNSPFEDLILYLNKNIDLSFLQDKSKDLFQIGDIAIPKSTAIKRAIKIIKDRIDRIGHREELYMKFSYDVKFGSHYIRLLLEGKELLLTGVLNFPLKDKQLILDIKQGKYNLKEVIELGYMIENQIRALKPTSILPKKPRLKEIESLQINLLKQFLGYN